MSRISIAPSKTVLPVLLGALLISPVAPSAEASGRGSDAIVVNTTNDGNGMGMTDGLCSLREAILAANTDGQVDGCVAGSGSDVIELPFADHELTIAGRAEDAGLTGDLDITENLIIRGVPMDGRRLEVLEVARVDGGFLDRVFHVQPGVTVQLENLSIRNGLVIQGPTRATRGGLPVLSGGGVLNQGTLTLIDSTVEFNGAGNSLLRDAVAGGGGGLPAFGGGIYSTGSLRLTGSTVFANLAQGTFSSNGTGGGAYGGGVAIANGGVLLVQDSIVRENEARGGDVGFSASGGGLALGGALWLDGDANIQDSTYQDNMAQGGGLSGMRIPDGSIAPEGGGGQNGDAAGGAIHVGVDGELTVLRSTFEGNGAQGGAGMPGDDGGGARGGSIYHEGSTLEVGSCTFVFNEARGGNGGDGVVFSLQDGAEGTRGANGGDGGLAEGGAIFSASVGVEIRQNTFAVNGAQGGDGGEGVTADRGGSAGSGGGAIGGHLAAVSTGARGESAFLIGNSILAGGTVTSGSSGGDVTRGGPGSAVGPACAGSVTSFLGNIETSDSCGFQGGSGDIVDALFGEVDLDKPGDNGGPTTTLALGGSSIAIDFGVVANCPAVDQRGFARLDGTCDSGSFELSAFESIFTDGFESGDVLAWSSSLGAM